MSFYRFCKIRLTLDCINATIALVTLEKYLAFAKISVVDFAKRARVDPVTIYRAIKQQTMPRGATLKKIIEASDGAISANEMIFVDRRKAG